MKNRQRNILLLGLISVAATLGATPAAAQFMAPDDVLTVRQRAVQDNLSLGIPVGSFLISPGVEVNSTWDDNISRTSSNKVSDLITDVKPAVGLQSNWDRHVVTLGAEGDFGEYKNNSALNFNDYGLLASGQYDIATDTYIIGSVTSEKRHEDQGSLSDPNGERPVAYTANAQQIEFSRSPGRLQLDVTARNENVSLSDIALSNIPGADNFTDRNEQSVATTVTYETVPGDGFFGTVAYDTTDYGLSSGGSGTSDGYNLRAGFNFDNGHTINGSLYGGYLLRNYSTGISNTNDPYFGGTLNWNATPLTTVTLTLDKTFNETTVAGAAGVVHTTRRIEAKQSVTPKVSLGFTLGADDNDYVGGETLDRDTRLYYGGVNGIYAISDNLGLRLGYDHEQRSSSLAGDQYQDNRVLVSLVFMR